MLTFRFTGSDGEMVISQTLTTGTIGQKVAFEFSGEWDALRKTAVFCAGEVCRIVDGVDHDAVIPAEVLLEPMQKLYVGVYGANREGTIVIPTIMVMGPEIRSGADPEQDPALDPEHPVWKQVQNDITECGEKIDALKEQVSSLWGEGDWNQLKNKPFYSQQFESFGSFPSVGEADFDLFPDFCYRVSELTPTEEEVLRTQFSITQQGITTNRVPVPGEIIAETPDVTLFQFATAPETRFLIVRNAGEIELEYGGLVMSSTAPETGIYCGISYGDSWIPMDIGISFTRIKQIDPIYIPQTENESDRIEEGRLLPSVSGEDNGKILQVTEGMWTTVPVASYVKAVNGNTPDENGNVEVEIPECGASSITILEETSLNGFEQDSVFGIHIIAVSPPPFALTIGETYKVYWDNVEYSVEALDVGQLIPEAAAVGNGSAFGMGGNPEAPFIIVQDSQGVSFAALVDYDQPHTVAIYQDDPAATQSYVRSYVEQYISEALGGDY